MDLSRFIAAIAAACALAHAHAECAPVEILDPAKNSTIHGTRPDIRWGGLPGVKVYRVQIESRVPEGQVIERIDTRVGDTRFVPPRPLTDRRAAVKVLVTADCRESSSVATRPAWFFIDVASTCSSIQKLSFSGASTSKVEWGRTSGATRYEVEAYSVSEGRLIARKETTVASAELPRADTPLIVAVRPRCESIVGEAAYGFLPASR